MLENRWSKDYLRGLFESTGRTHEDLKQLVATCRLESIEDPMLEIRAMRQGGSAVEGYNFGIAALALCREDAPVSLIAELIETVEVCMMALRNAREMLPSLKEAVNQDPRNGEKLAKLGFKLYTLENREEALTALTKALEFPDTLCFSCHCDCLNTIGWEHYRQGEYAQALGWFQISCGLKAPGENDVKHLDGDVGAEPSVPFKIAFENMLLTMAKLGQLREATEKLQEYHDCFGRLTNYESRALEKLGLQPDVIFIRSCTRAVGENAGQ